MQESFKFLFNTETYVGIDYYKKIPELLQAKGYKKILVLVDQGVVGITPFLFLKEKLEASQVLAALKVARGNEEPDYDYLDEVANELRQIETDCIIAVGGGSTLDLAKAIAVLLTNPGKGLDYRGFDKVGQPGIPLMAIPTTAGTGSEITINAVFTNKAENKKLGINGRYMHATYAVLDPVFTVSAPVKVAVSSGIDALVHTLESFVGINANMMTRFFAKEAFKLLYWNLPAIIDAPNDLQKRLNIQLGAYFAAVSLFNSSSGIAGAISYPLGTYYKVPHGIGGGMFAVPVVKYNVESGYYDYAELYDVIHPNSGLLSAKAKSEQLVKLLEELILKLDVPKKLSVFGIAKESYNHIVEIMQSLQAAFDQNPIKLNVTNVDIFLKPFF